MKYYIFSLLCFAYLLSCKNNKPDISIIKVETTFQDFYTPIFKLDTNNLKNDLGNLIKSKPYETDLYFNQILGAPSLDSFDNFSTYIKRFISYHQPIYDTFKKISSQNNLENKVENTLKYYKYYFSKSNLPKEVIFFLGPLDGHGYAYDEADNKLWIGVQKLLGKNYSLYQSNEMQTVYAGYVQERFTLKHMPILVVEKLLNTNYSKSASDQSLINQMIEKGKTLYILNKICPDNNENEIFYVNEKKWKWCIDNEKYIWDFFIQNELLQSRNAALIKPYLNDGPLTQEFGEQSPGNLGSFCGWQIVKKYMKNNASLTLEDLLKLDANELFQNTKYKP